MRTLATILTLAFLLLVSAQAVPAADEAAHQFVGVAGCKTCHKSEKSGNQYGIWLESRHAGAYETLGTDAAKAAAAERGLEGNPQELDECLRCHVTGHGADAALLGPKYAVTDGVGCESCHGAGGDYKSKKIMEDHDAAVANGLKIPTVDTCKGCHNEESPSYKPFDFEEFYAKIAHPTPAAD